MKTHQFQSITEEQWKSGLSRHKCALCAYDYDDPVHSVSNWPLVIVIEDCFVPQSARLVITTVREMDTEAVGAQLQLEAAIAELFLERN